MNDVLYIFFHIRKTAGTSLRDFLTNLPNSKTELYWHYDWNKTLVPSEKTRSIKYMIGHEVYYGLHVDINRPNAKYIIFLRNPIQRCLSFYYHFYITDIIEKRKPLNVDLFFKSSNYIEIVKEISYKQEISSLERSKQILQDTSFIGFQETFKEDVEKLFGKNIKIPLANVSIEKAKKINTSLIKLTDKEMQIIHELTKEDRELYDYAIKLRNQGHNNGFRIT
jgi:hypothetical protein